MHDDSQAEHLSQETQVESINVSGQAREIKKVVISETMSTEFGHVKMAGIGVTAFDCGHTGSTADAVMTSSGEVICKACNQRLGQCACCGRALSTKGRVESLWEANVFYCRRWCRFFGWLKRIF